MWKKYGTTRQTTDDIIIWGMRFSCWITKATHTHSDYVMFITDQLQQQSRERAYVLHYTYVACLVNSPELVSIDPAYSYSGTTSPYFGVLF